MKNHKEEDGGDVKVVPSTLALVGAAEPKAASLVLAGLHHEEPEGPLPRYH